MITADEEKILQMIKDRISQRIIKTVNDVEIITHARHIIRQMEEIAEEIEYDHRYKLDDNIERRD